AKIAIPLWNLIFEDQLISKGVPGQVGDHPVVLVTVLASMRENDIWLKLSGEIFERVLDHSELGGEISVPKFVQADGFGGSRAQKPSGSALRFRRTPPDGAPDHPAEFRPGSPFRQL